MTDLKPSEHAAELTRKTVLMEFPGDRDKMSGEYSVFGGVAWPEWSADVGATFPKGTLLICGRRIVMNKPERFYVFREIEFFAVEPTLDGTTVLNSGATDAFNRAWADYFCRNYYQLSQDDVEKKWEMKVMRSSQIEPKPRFVDIMYGKDLKNAEQTLWERFQAGTLSFPANGYVDKAMHQRVLDKTAPVTAALRAMIAAVMGDEAYPWRLRL